MLCFIYHIFIICNIYTLIYIFLCQVYIIEDSNTFTYNIEPQLNYSESIEYFENLQKCLNEHQDLSSTYKSENKEYLMEHNPCEAICNWNITEKEMIFYEKVS